MGEFSNLNGYDVKDKKAVRVYDNVEAMKDDYSIRAGQTVQTLGYYTANDGGSAEYIITDDDALTPDNMMIYQVGNSLFAELIQTDEINVKQLGAYGDDTHDDTVYIQTAFDNFRKIIIPDGTYKITSSLYVNENNIIKGINSTIDNHADNPAIRCTLKNKSDLCIQPEPWITENNSQMKFTIKDNYKKNRFLCCF